jgi:hypothetical protein
VKRPLGIVYGIDDVPPFGISVLSGLQHVGIISVIVVHPLHHPLPLRPLRRRLTVRAQN